MSSIAQQPKAAGTGAKKTPQQIFQDKQRLSPKQYDAWSKTPEGKTVLQALLEQR